MNKEKDEDKRIEVDNEDENKYYIYFIDKWMYKYHRTDINNKKISLRCSDRKCRGTAVVDNGIKKHSNPHSIAFEDHEYMKLDAFIRKYQKNELSKEEMKTLYYQKLYFEYIFNTFFIII